MVELKVYATHPVTLAPRIIRYSVFGSWLLCCLTIAVSLLPITPPLWILYIPFVLSFLLLGLPHGAADHDVLLKLWNKQYTPRSLFAVLAPYILLAGIYLILWWVAPLLSFVAFILLTWFHWGQGDLYSICWFTGKSHLNKQWHLYSTVIIRGGLPMLVPLIAFPDIYERVAMDVISNLSPGIIFEYDVLFSFQFRMAMGLLFAAIVLIHVISTYKADTSWYIDVLEIAQLLLFFLLVNPILAIGIYFCFWHGLRHILRIAILYDTEERRLVSGLRHFIIRVIPTTCAALIFLAAMYYTVPSRPQSIEQFIGLYLILIAILTLPHTIVVYLMDRKDRVWHSNEVRSL